MITGPSSYDSTMTEFNQHWASANTKLAPTPLILTLPDKTSMSRAQFATLHITLLARQDSVRTWAVDVQIARGEVNLRKAALLARFNLFTSLVDASYQGTGFYAARPLAPSISDGKEVFLQPLGNHKHSPRPCRQPRPRTSRVTRHNPKRAAPSRRAPARPLRR